MVHEIHALKACLLSAIYRAGSLLRVQEKFCGLTWMGFSSLDVGSAAKTIFPEFAQVSQFAGYAGSAWNSYSTYDQRTVSSVFKTSVRFWRDIREPDQVLIRALQKKVPGDRKIPVLRKRKLFINEMSERVTFNREPNAASRTVLMNIDALYLTPPVVTSKP